MNITLTGQKIEQLKIQPLLDKAELLLTQREPVWNKLDDEEKKKWLQSNKDPILTIEYNHLLFLKEFFGELDK